MGLVCCGELDDVEEVRFGGKSMWQMLRAGMEMADLIIFANVPETIKSSIYTQEKYLNFLYFQDSIYKISCRLSFMNLTHMS